MSAEEGADTKETDGPKPITIRVRDQVRRTTALVYYVLSCDSFSLGVAGYLLLAWPTSSSRSLYLSGILL